MPDLLYTTNYRLRKPQSADLRSIEDFRRVFNDNPEIIDRELKTLNDTLSALTGLAGEVEETGNTAKLLPLLNRLYLLESSAFAGLRKGDDGLWYAYNKDGQDVDGPFDFGSGNAGGVTTLAEYFNAVEDDSIVYEDPTPVTGATVSPDRTLAGILNAVPDDTVIYEDPTPISA